MRFGISGTEAPFQHRLGPCLLFALLCFSCASNANTPWVQVDTEHIRLRTRQSRLDATESAAALQEAHNLMSDHALPCSRPKMAAGPRIQVTTLSSEDYDRVASPHTAGVARTLRGMFPAERGEQLILRDEFGLDARRVFQHELAHRLVASCFPSAPVWLNEGLASFLETTHVQGEEAVLGFPRYFSSQTTLENDFIRYRGQVIEVVPHSRLPPLRSLLRASPAEFYSFDTTIGDDMNEERAANYALAWALVHYLEVGGGQERAQRFHRYLGALTTGQDANSAWQRWVDDEGLATAVPAYLKGPARGYLAIPYHPRKPATGTVVPMSAAEGEAQLGWLSPFNTPQGRSRALMHAQHALHMEPTLIDAHWLKATSLTLGEDFVSARDAVEEGLKHVPDDPTLLSAWLELQLALQETAAPKTSQVSAQLKSKARTAPHFTTLARLELSTGNVNAALLSSQRALELDPQNWRSWLVYAQALAIAGQSKEASQAAWRALHLAPHTMAGVKKQLEALL